MRVKILLAAGAALALSTVSAAIAFAAIPDSSGPDSP